MKVTTIRFLVLTGILIMPSLGYSEEKNLVPNPGFEEIAGDVPVGWTFNPKGKGNIRLDSTVKHSGDKSLRIIKMDQCGFITVASELIKVTPNKKYAISGYIKIKEVDGDGRGNAFWMWQTFDKDKRLLEKSMKIGAACGTVDWHKQRRIITTDSETAYIRVVAIIHMAQGTAWFDDVVLTAIVEPDLPPAGYLIYAPKSAFDKILPTTLPTVEDVKREFRIFVTPGEYEPLSFVIYTEKELKFVEIEIGDLVSNEGHIISRDNIDLRIVKLLPQMRSVPARGEGKRKDLILVPELLENESVFHIPEKSSQQFWLTIKAPRLAKAGIYRTVLKVRPDNAPEQETAIVVEVMPFSLEKPSRSFGLYYHTIDRWEIKFGRPVKTSANYEKDLLLMKEYGVEIIVTGRLALLDIERDGDRFKIDYRRLIEFFDMCEKAGMKTIILEVPVMVRHVMRKMQKNSGRDGKLEKKDIHNLIAQVATEVHGLVKKKGYSFGLLWTGIDEVQQRSRTHPELVTENLQMLAALRKAVPSLRTYQTYSDPRTAFKKNKENKELNDLVDVRCYGGNMEKRVGVQKIYAWKLYDHFKKAEKEASSKGGEIWCYYNTHALKRFHVEEERLANGFWIWRTPFKVNIPCQSQIYFGNPYVDNDDNGDNDGAFGESMTLFYPSVIDGSPIPTITLVAYREGIDDLRYINTLEAAIARCKKENIKPAEVAAAEGLLKQLREKLDSLRTLPKMAQAFELKDYNEMRYKIAKAINNLQVR